MTIEQILQDIRDKHFDKPVEVSTTNKKKASQATRDNIELAEFQDLACGLFIKWLQRGDGIAVYENKAMDSSNLGHKQFCSYGSSAAQIETAEPPQRMPDIGKVNWAYQLVASYKLESKEVCDV